MCVYLYFLLNVFQLFSICICAVLVPTCYILIIFHLFLVIPFRLFDSSSPGTPLNHFINQSPGFPKFPQWKTRQRQTETDRLATALNLVHSKGFRSKEYVKDRLAQLHSCADKNMAWHAWTAVPSPELPWVQLLPVVVQSAQVQEQVPACKTLGLCNGGRSNWNRNAASGLGGQGSPCTGAISKDYGSYRYRRALTWNMDSVW